jgi:hypothetical protein
MSERARSRRPEPVAPDPDADEGGLSFADTSKQQADFEGNVREHDDDWQEGVEAQERGEEPPEEEKSVTGA